MSRFVCPECGGEARSTLRNGKVYLKCPECKAKLNGWKDLRSDPVMQAPPEEPTPVETDNSPRPEDGEQDVSQEPGSVEGDV